MELETLARFGCGETADKLNTLLKSGTAYFLAVGTRDAIGRPRWPMRTSDLIPAWHVLSRWQQADGRPSGAHAAFKPYGVDAATLRLVVAEGRVSSWTRPTFAYLGLAAVPWPCCHARRDVLG